MVPTKLTADTLAELSLAPAALEALPDLPHIKVTCWCWINRADKHVAYFKDEKMSRVSLLSAPFLLGFDAFEERLDRLAKAADSYPPYNIERQLAADGDEHFVISIAVAGFSQQELEVRVDDNQLIVRGRQAEEADRQFLHRGIATRQFQRCFLLADGMLVENAALRDGLLVITALRPKPEKASRLIKIDIME